MIDEDELPIDGSLRIGNRPGFVGVELDRGIFFELTPADARVMAQSLLDNANEAELRMLDEPGNYDVGHC